VSAHHGAVVHPPHPPQAGDVLGNSHLKSTVDISVIVQLFTV